MRSRILLLRILESVFLVGVIFKLFVIDSSLKCDFSILEVGFKYGITDDGDIPVFNTTLIGYILSAFATHLQSKVSRPAVKTASEIISILGILTYTNEVMRMLFGYSFQFSAAFPIVLVILDWWMFRDTQISEAPSPAS